MREIIINYRKGMKQFDDYHGESQSVKGNIQCIKQEWAEFCESLSIEEFFDVLHTCGRLIEHLTGIWLLCLIAWPTVKKHAIRMEKNGCPRSQRNCCGKCRKEFHSRSWIIFQDCLTMGCSVAVGARGIVVLPVFSRPRRPLNPIVRQLLKMR